MPQVEISVNMVVKNEEEYIEKAILSTGGIAKEILIYDTGSTDLTPKIIEKLSQNLPIKLIKGNLSVDSARNVLLELSRGNWILILDGDEVWEEAEKLPELPVLNPDKIAFGFTFNHYLTSDKLAIRHKSKSIKLFKKTPGIHWINEFPNEILEDDKGILSTTNCPRTDIQTIWDLKFNHYGGIKKNQWRKEQPAKFHL